MAPPRDPRRGAGTPPPRRRTPAGSHRAPAGSHRAPAGAHRAPAPRRRPPADGGPPVTARVRAQRLRVLSLIAVLVLGLLAARAAFIGTVRADDLSSRAAGQQRADRTVPAPRGTILSSDGAELSVDRRTVDVTATPYLVDDPTAAAARLGPLLEVAPADIEAKLREGGGYAVLAKDVPPGRADRAEKLGIVGIDFTDTFGRTLPRGPLAAQVLGLTSADGEGLSGLEAQYDDELTGVPGRRLEARDPIGRPLRVLIDEPARPGASIQLSIDAVLQSKVEQVLATTRSDFGATSASAIILRPSDGAVLAMATVPLFNPNDRSAIDVERERNRTVTDVFDPGSTFKVVTIAGALQTGTVTPDTVFHLPVELVRYDRTLNDSHERPALDMSVAEILQQSSNIGTVLIAERFGERRVQRWIDNFGFGSRTGIDFPGEVPGIVRPPEEWSGASIINIPIGQGISVTLLQITSAYATIANGGRAVTPRLVERIGGRPVVRPPGRRVLNARTAAQMNEILRGVVSEEGTGSLAQVEGFEVAGKTGTAEKLDENGQYTDKYVASFVGYAPAERPELLVAVAVDEPTKGAYYGGDVAAPAFEQIMEFALQRREIAP